MPIFESRGKQYNIPDDKVNDFTSKRKDARLIDNEPYSIVRTGSTPRQSNIQNKTDTQVEENTVQQTNNGVSGGFTTFKDGTSGFIPAMKMPDIKIQQPQLGLSKSQITKGTSFENKTLLDSTRETVRNMPVSPEAHFDSAQSAYKQNQDWIKEVQNDSSMSNEVKQALLDDYNNNIRISDNTIEDKDLPLYAKQWLDNNKVSVPTTVYVPGSPMFGGGQYVESTKQVNTPEQIAFIKDFIANTPQGQDLVNRQKAYVEYLENSISDAEHNIKALRSVHAQELDHLQNTHPYSTGKTNGKSETDAKRKDYIEKRDEIVNAIKSTDLAEKNAEDQKKLLAAVRDGDLNVLSQFGKQIGRDFWEMAGDIGTLGIRPMMQSLYESSDVKGLQERMDKGKLTEEDRLAMSAMANNQAYQELMGDRRTIAQEVASGITYSMPTMVNFVATGGIGKAVTGGAKELLKQGVKRNAINAIKQGAKIGTEKLGARLAGFGLNVADATGRASVMAAISPHTYRDMFDNMTGQVTYGYDEEGKPYYLGNVEQMDVTNALLNAWGSNTIENVSEFSGFGMEKGQVALSRLLKQRVPEIAKALSFGSTRNQFFQGVNKAMKTAGFNGTVNEFLEEQVSTVLHSFFEDGQAQWSDLTDPRQQFITYLTVAAIGSGSAIMNTNGNQLMKHGAKKAYNNAFQDFGTEFYNSQNNDIAGQFADAVRNGTIEEKQSALSDIVNSGLFNDKQKLAALNLYRAGLTYESYEGTKEAQVEEATQEIPAMVEENANPEMNAIVSATIAGQESPVQITGGNIVPNEDGTINREQSDKEIYYIDSDGNKQVTSINYVENITENVPTQDAIAQVTEQVAAPIIAQQENEEVRPYQAGETVRFSPDGNTSLVGQIIGQNEDGSYILQEVTTGQQIPVQPRQIINEDNLIGVENGSPVIYTNQNGEQVQDIVATTPDLYTQGLIAFENGDVVKIDNVIGLAQNTDAVIPVSEQNQTVTDGELAPSPTDMMIGENGAVPYNPNNTVANEQNIESIIANAPKQKNGKVDYNALMDTDPNAFAQIWESRSGPEATQAQLQKVSDNIASQITSQQNKLSKETDFNKIADIEDAISELQNRKEGIDSVINNRYTQHSEVETPVSESEVNLSQAEHRENEHLWDIAENSDNPIDIASAYNEAMQTAGEERLDEWQKQLLGRKVNRVSFERFGDRNLINGAIARSWFNRKGEESNSGSIDVIAQELDIDARSIVEFIVDHPSNRVKRGNDLTESLNTRFKEIAQRITGREVGGIESNSGKLFLSTLEYAANNTPTEVETEFMQSDVISNIPNAVEFFLSDYMRLDEISDFNEFKNTVEEADRQGYFMFPLEPKDKETILNYINNAERQAKSIQGIDENVSSSSVIEDGKEIVSLDTENTTNNEQGEQISERVSQRVHREGDGVNSDVERRASNNRGRETSTSDIRQVTRGKGSKQQQLEILESYAKENGIWIDKTSNLGEQFSEGGENEVLYSPETNSVFKLNNFEYAGDDVVNLLDRLDAHNLLFPNVSYTLVGFAKNSKGETSAVLEQPYVKANQEREATAKEIADYMQELGFEQINEDTYTNKKYEVFDAFSNNVLLGADGLLYPIDTQIRSNAQENTERFDIIETENGKYQVIDTETNQQKSRAYANRKSAEKQQQALYEALSNANKSTTELEAYPFFSKESQNKADRALSVLDSFDPSNITLQDANKIIDIISNKPVPFFQVQQALDTKSMMIGNQDYYTPDYLKKYILYSTKDIPASGSIAEKIAQAEAETNTNPTEAQKEAGNYKKGKVTIQGLDISIEQPRGSVRSGTDQNGKKWSIEMQNTYGYIGKTKSKDGDHIDVFLGKNPENPILFVVDQVNQDGSFDEHKVMLGFDSIEQARDAYLSNYEEGWQGLGNITQTDIDTFKKWATSDTRKIKPFAEYKDIQDGPQFQSSEKVFTPVSEKTFNELVDRLKQTGLARDVITDKAAFDKKLNEASQFMQTNMGDVYGFVTPDGTVYLDSTRMNANTPIHEFGHLWVDFIQQQNPDLYQTGENLILDSVYWDKVQDNPHYSTLTQEQQINEAMAMAIGDKGASIVDDKGVGQKLLDWIQSVWEWIGNKIGIRDLNSSQLQDLTLNQFTDLAAADLLRGKDIANIPNAPESLDNIRFQSVGDVANATNSSMTEEMRKELDRKTSGLQYRIREGWEDKHLAVKEFQDILRKNGVDIAEYNDYHKQATHIAGKNDAQLEHYNNQFQKPLNEAIADLENDGWEHRDIENYAILKHGLERNAWMRQDAIDKYMAANPNATQEQIDKFTENLPDDYSGVTSVEEETKQTAQEFIDEFESETSKNLIDNFWKRINNATSYSLKKQLDGGFINKKFFDELTSRYDYYIPLRGHDLEVAEDRWDYAPDEGTYFVNPVMKANGRRSRAEKPFAYIASAAQSAINSANRNALNQIWKRLAAKDTTGLLSVNKSWYVQNGNIVDGKPEYEMQEAAYSENPEQYRKNIDEFEERMQQLAEQGLATQRTGKLDIGGLFIKNKQKKQHAVSVYQNGTEYTVYINANPAIARAINGTNVVDPGKFFQSIANGSRFLATNFTTRNPAFVVSNFSRDLIFASSILPVKENAKYAYQFEKNIISGKAGGALWRYIKGNSDLTKQQDRYMIEYIMNGAKTGFSHILELQKVQKQIERDIKKSKGKGILDYSVRPVIDALSAANDFAENLSRLSVYITSREEGRSIIQSVSDAKEVTVNFNKSGTGAMGAAYVRSLYLFVNVAVQALSNIMKVGKNNKGKMSAMLSTYMLSGAMIAPSLALLFGGDDGLDEYFKLNDWERKNNFCIYTGKGFIKIPLPQELRVFHSMGDNFAQWYRGDMDTTEALMDTSLGMSDLLPTNPLGTATASLSDFQNKGSKDAVSTAASLLSPDIAKPFAQLIANRSFTGSRIVNEWANKNDPGYKQVRTNKKGDLYAPAFLVDMAESLDNITGGDGVQKGWASLNPDVINHLMRGYFGGLYTMSTDVIGMGAKGIDKITGDDTTLKAREVPIFKNFYTSSDDIQTTSSGLNSKYFKIADDTQEAMRKVKSYKDQVADGKLSVTDFYSKIEKLNVPKANELYGRIKQIKKYESALKELDGQDQKDLEKIISDLKKEVIEINNKLSK